MALDGFRLAVRSEIIATRKHATFKIEGFTVVSRLLEGDFHDYNASIPKASATEVTINVRDLSEALERCSLLVTERVKGPVKCLFNMGGVAISCEIALGKATDTVASYHAGPSLEIGFNCKYFLDALKKCGCDKVRLCMNSAITPLKILPPEGDGFVALVLPCRLKN